MFFAVSLALALVYASAAIGPIFQPALQEVEVVPTQCVDACSPVGNITSTGCTVVQCCTETFEAAYFECLSCVGLALNVTDYGPAQDSLDTLIAACGVRQLDLSTNRTFPGEDPNRIIATSSLLASASAAFQPNVTDVLPSGSDLTTSSQQSTITGLPGAFTSSSSQATVTAPGETESTQPDGNESSGVKSVGSLSAGAAMLQIVFLYTIC